MAKINKTEEKKVTDQDHSNICNTLYRYMVYVI